MKKEPELFLWSCLGWHLTLPRWHVNSWILRVDLILESRVIPLDT